MPSILEPWRMGPLDMRNRMVMAPMTRSRADGLGLPTELVVEYYRQRATAGLIITEGTSPSPMGMGYVRTPGIFSDAQVAAWRKVTDAVHNEGGKIFVQLMHCGRISHPSMLPENADPIAPSAIKAAGMVWTEQGQLPLVTPRALETDEITGIIQDFSQAARRAIEAGFDGIELHGAGGYLPEQFLSTKTNNRTDDYGGPVINRARFMIEVLHAMAMSAGANRVGLRIGPEMQFNDISDENPAETYSTLIDEISGMGLAYLHVTQFQSSTDYHSLLRPRFKGTYLAGGGLTKESASALIEGGRADAAVFGSLFLANPDLPARFAAMAPLNKPESSTFYTPGAAGYTDYPTLESI